MKRARRSLLALAAASLLICVALTGCPAGGGGDGTVSTFKRLWVPHYNAGELRAWNAARLDSDLDASPDVVLTLPAGTRPNAITFDPSGALWVTDNANNRLLKFGKTQLDASGSPAPEITIGSDAASLAAPIGLAFDNAGNLWVAAAKRLEFYVPGNLAQSGPTTPTRTLDAAGFDTPAGIAIDASGNLWLTNASFTVNKNAVMVFAPGQLAAGGRQTPQLTIQSSAFNLVEGIRLDGSGNLWVSSNDALNVARFSAAQIALPAASETRTLTPSASLEADPDDSATGRTVRKPGGLVFTGDGVLFVNSERGNAGSDVSAVLKFTADQLTGLSGVNALGANVIIRRATSNPGFGGVALEL